jgi:metal-responsive CopG/Arc/MetJ family transcriptional regulator
MKRITIFADDHLLHEMRFLAQREKKSVAQVIREAMEQYIAAKRQPAGKLSIVGIGESGRNDIADKNEKLLW